jgi:hypothetical protein
MARSILTRGSLVVPGVGAGTTVIFVPVIVAALSAGRTSRLIRVLNPMQRIDKIAQHLDRQHDGVATATHILGDFDDPTAVILLQVEEENLPISDQFFRMQRRLVVAAKSAAPATAPASKSSASASTAAAVSPALIAILAVATARVFIVIKRHVSVLLLDVVIAGSHFPSRRAEKTPDSRKSSGYRIRGN